jgi:hypothetical protein
MEFSVPERLSPQTYACSRSRLEIEFKANKSPNIFPTSLVSATADSPIFSNTTKKSSHLLLLNP